MALSDAARELLDWYDRERRDLPWRAAPGSVADPYAVWLSEVMLQQTTVAAVKDYFRKFLTQWPRVEDLARAPLDDVLAAWAGLGYYARARNLHKCAVTVTNDYDGQFPATEAALLALPGIGAYTAAAIAAIAFSEPATVVDGNVERVIARLYRVNTPLPKAKPEIKELTAGIAPTAKCGRPGDFAQAMMDLGATICTPKNPQCLLCPWQRRCAALSQGDMLDYPKKLPKKPKPTRRIVAFWPVSDGHVLLERRPEAGLLGGMLGLFATDWEERSDFPTNWSELEPVAAEWDLLDSISRHTFTHFHLESKVAVARLSTRANTRQGQWVPLADLDGLPTVFKKMKELAQS